MDNISISYHREVAPFIFVRPRKEQYIFAQENISICLSLSPFPILWDGSGMYNLRKHSFISSTHRQHLKSFWEKGIHRQNTRHVQLRRWKEFFTNVNMKTHVKIKSVVTSALPDMYIMLPIFLPEETLHSLSWTNYLTSLHTKYEPSPLRIF